MSLMNATALSAELQTFWSQFRQPAGIISDVPTT